MRHLALILGWIGFGAFQASAVELDWSGQFRAESHWIYNYTMDIGNINTDTGRAGRGGYYIPGGGSKDAFFQAYFMRLRPSIIVNDNIYLKSEWWVGDPVFSFFGSGAPYTPDQRQYNSTFSRGSFITAQRLWAEFLSDLGTVYVGRQPLHWGLGLVWNAGNDIYDRYMSTGDAVRISSKFGAFTFSSGLIKYNMGNSIAGNCSTVSGNVNSVTGVCNSGNSGGGGVSDISIAFKYDNPDESIEMGLNFIKRIAGPNQGEGGFYGVQANPVNTSTGTGGTANSPVGMNYNVWDIYGKKGLGPVTLGVEAPITSGTVGTARYKTYALAAEASWKINEPWEAHLKFGHAPGQGDINSATPDVYRAFYFHPNYHLGLIMFNYQFANFAGPNNNNSTNTGDGGARSPYDNPVVNANYLAAGGSFKADKWSFRANVIYAKANETAGSSAYHFNYWQRQFFLRNANQKQSNDLGWEMDYGSTFRWDENFRFDLDFGWYFPGDFYQFSNTAKPNAASTVFAVAFKAGVTF